MDHQVCSFPLNKKSSIKGKKKCQKHPIHSKLLVKWPQSILDFISLQWNKNLTFQELRKQAHAHLDEDQIIFSCLEFPFYSPSSNCPGTRSAARLLTRLTLHLFQPHWEAQQLKFWTDFWRFIQFHTQHHMLWLTDLPDHPNMWVISMNLLM